jgi:hydrogenase maturation protein HypF
MAGRRSKSTIVRKHYQISGIVQGVGFRPFVYRLAHELELSGWIRNTPAGVELEVQGRPGSLTIFDQALIEQAPPLAEITSCSSYEVPAEDCHAFTIMPSASGAADIQVAPDSKLCVDCLRELFDPSDRRYRYPFITCTNCGPRYSIITSTPYDRAATTMAGFPLCPDCLKEYRNPADRRFHAQPVACPECGPHMTLVDASGRTLATGDDAILQAVARLSAGKILAVKGIGGYHLAVDAFNHDAVRRLRERKKRDEKPFAIMAADMATARRLALMTELDERLLESPEAPIVIVAKRIDSQLSSLLAPCNGWIGLMLPYAPQHFLLFAPLPSIGHSLPERANKLNALVMTSGNSSDEPILFQDHEAVQKLSGIADFLLIHNRPIHIREDDSVVRVFKGSPLFYRRARGYAPRAVRMPFESVPVLAVGAELKSAVCLARGKQAFLSQHIGDLKNDPTCDSFRHIIDHLSCVLEITPTVVACDLHPDYLSTRMAEDMTTAEPNRLFRVQHHHAHLAGCMAENGLVGEVIGIIFDGTGYGSDGTIWGGEFLIGGYDGIHRAGHLRPVRLPGGDAAVREPWRMALSYLHQSMGSQALTLSLPVAAHLAEAEMELFAAMLQKGINAPYTSSCGRLFDAVAALLDIRQIVSYDGQAAMELEACAENVEHDGVIYPFDITQIDTTPLHLDFIPMFLSILSDIDAGVPTSVIARRFHATLVHGSVLTCLRIAGESACNRVVLSGGVFQNRLLTDMMYTDLTKAGLQVFTHRLIPPNDGGIALGQAAVAGWKTRRVD